MGDSPKAMIGRTIANRYRIVQHLGSGGFGAVFLAEAGRLGHPVALKILGQSVTDEAVRARFRQEAQAISRLQSPGVVKLVDFDEDEDGLLFIAMEYVRGSTLASVARRSHAEDGGMEPQRVLRLAKEIAEVLVEAHGLNIVHRDLKPQNVILQTIADVEHVKVLDFGVARMIDTPGLTSEGAQLGTATYMSPEQVLTDPVDGRSDLYALGVIMYECLIGVAPFAGEPLQRMYHHVHTAPPAFAEVAPERAIPPDVESLVMWLLEKRPEHRPQSASIVLSELEELLRESHEISIISIVDEEPESVEDSRPPPVPSPPGASGAIRRRYWLGAALLALAALLLLGTTLLWERHSISEEASRASAPTNRDAGVLEGRAPPKEATPVPEGWSSSVPEGAEPDGTEPDAGVRPAPVERARVEARPKPTRAPRVTRPPTSRETQPGSWGMNERDGGTRLRRPQIDLDFEIPLDP